MQLVFPARGESKSNTKVIIFNTALRLFAIKGVENISMRNIADAVGIKAASIYNHYKSKEQIVDDCYEFFLQYHCAGWLNKEQYILVLQNGTKEEIVKVQFTANMMEEFQYSMSMLFARIHTDEKAIKIYEQMIDNSMQFLKEFFETGIRLGRFEEFNIEGVSMIFLSARLFVAQSITMSHEGWSKIQQEMVSELINLIPFKY